MWNPPQIPTTTTGGSYYYCGHCGGYHSGSCPRVEEIEYWPDGTIKRVKYYGQNK